MHRGSPCWRAAEGARWGERTLLQMGQRGSRSWAVLLEGVRIRRVVHQEEVHSQMEAHILERNWEHIHPLEVVVLLEEHIHHQR